MGNKYSSSNYGSSRAVKVNDITLYFSYETIVAFSNHHGLCIRENDWGATTGKHLNAINPDKSIRISGEEFEKILDKELEKYQFKEELKA